MTREELERRIIEQRDSLVPIHWDDLIAQLTASWAADPDGERRLAEVISRGPHGFKRRPLPDRCPYCRANGEPLIWKDGARICGRCLDAAARQIASMLRDPRTNLPEDPDTIWRCQFCLRSRWEVGAMYGGNSAFLCDSCCSELLQDRHVAP